MTNTVPIAVLRYFAARSPQAVVNCFSDDGTAMDEGNMYHGKAEILQWREAASKIQFEEEILSSRQDGSQTIVSCRLTGDFKGSPVNLDFCFELDGDQVSRLEIA
ncbi:MULTISPECIES: nuclear transport factor 2 family protein [Cohaesibacter]|uniref:nuclear transport factor 2 family protein n=1 Tax=Cohaesibacter TaxID=655352 RepID=UPI000DE9F4EF|nr:MULTISPECIES: nuclear transport factor 2 family protein [Cohaesibacter]TLP45941.1 nuclear transport factor 2 family protein [Cohaesibacter sp. CAU 1516]